MKSQKYTVIKKKSYPLSEKPFNQSAATAWKKPASIYLIIINGTVAVLDPGPLVVQNFSHQPEGRAITNQFESLHN